MKFGFKNKNKHVKCGSKIKSVLFKVCSITCYTFFQSFGQLMNNKNYFMLPLSAFGLLYIFLVCLSYPLTSLRNLEITAGLLEDISIIYFNNILKELIFSYMSYISTLNYFEFSILLKIV